jgi:HAMP domain-containing protein
MGADLSLLWLMYLLHDIDVRENSINLMPALFGKEDLGVYSFILGPNGEYIAHPDRSRSLKGESFFDYADDSGNDKYRLLGESMCKGETGADAVKMDGRRYSVFFAPVSDSGWSMALAVPFMSLLGPALLFGSAILLIMLLGIMVLFGVSRRAIRRFTRPLVQLADSATEVAHGKFDAPLPVIESDDEIRLLRDSFGNMQQSLSKYIADLTETTAQKASIESELEVAKSIQMAMLPTSWPAFPERKDIDIYRIDAMDAAAEMNLIKTFNMIVLGGLLKIHPVVGIESVLAALRKTLPERHHHLIPKNEEAIRKGMEIIKKL